MNKQAIIERLSADEDRCKYCNSSTISGGDIYCSAGYSHDMNCGGKEFKLDYKIEEVISALEQQLTNGWIPVSERLPEPKEWCWVWFDYDEEGHSSGNGFCEKMYLSSNGKWMKNTLSTVKDEYMNCIRAWQPYFEPEPYKEVSE